MSYVCFTQKITLINCFAYIFCILLRWILSLLSLRFICTATKLPPAVMLFPLMDVQLHPGCVTQAGLVVEYVLYIFSWFWWLNRAFFKNLISEKLWHFDLQKQTRCQTRSNQRCKLTSKIGLTGPTPNKESQVELICAALNHISLKEPHTHISTQQMADCFSVLCEIRHDCGRFSPEGHISCTQEAYVLWFYNMGEKTNPVCGNALRWPTLRRLKTSKGLCCWLSQRHRARRLNITKESVFSVCRCHFTVTGEKTAAEGGLNISSVNTKVLQQIQSSFIF